MGTERLRLQLLLARGLSRLGYIWQCRALRRWARAVQEGSQAAHRAVQKHLWLACDRFSLQCQRKLVKYRCLLRWTRHSTKNRAKDRPVSEFVPAVLPCEYDSGSAPPPGAWLSERVSAIEASLDQLLPPRSHTPVLPRPGVPSNDDCSRYVRKSMGILERMQTKMQLDAEECMRLRLR